ncbi:MAG TPA: acetyl-CoA carboxylase biotin carboxyl carrier protein subunit [bacterium]|nr:acetyl-CoA carboxylase biotin carboxyl carrier protein subunit [bacterium]
MPHEEYKATIKIKGRKLKLRIEEKDPESIFVAIEGDTYRVRTSDLITRRDWSKQRDEDEDMYLDEEGNTVVSPIPGVIARLAVGEREDVQKGQVLLLLLAMKMENEICSPRDGTVKRIRVQEGQAVQANDVLLEFE